MKNQIRKLIREKIQKLFEMQEFQGEEVAQLEKSKAIYTLPRKGIADDINTFNQLQAEKEKDETAEQREAELDNEFETPASNNGTAPTLTNVYENASVVGGVVAQMQNLDSERGGTRPPKAVYPFGKEQQKAIEDFNDNIDRDLNQIQYPGDTEGMLPANNKHF